MVLITIHVSKEVLMHTFLRSRFSFLENTPANQTISLNGISLLKGITFHVFEQTIMK